MADAGGPTPVGGVVPVRPDGSGLRVGSSAVDDALLVAVPDLPSPLGVPRLLVTPLGDTGSPPRGSVATSPAAVPASATHAAAAAIAVRRLRRAAPRARTSAGGADRVLA